MWHWKDRNVNQWIGIDSEIDPHIYGQLIFDKVLRYFNGERIVFPTVAGKTGYSYIKN